METLSEVEKRLRAALRKQVLLARDDPVEFVRRVGRQENGAPIYVEPVQAEWHRLLSEHDRVVLFAPVGHGKALAADTEIPTPSGWTKIRGLRPGDYVFNRYGEPVRVAWTSGVYLADEVYELKFAKGATLIADADHQWVVRQSQIKGAREVVLTTRQIVESLTYTSGSKAGKPRWRVPVACPAKYPEVQYEVDPYVLGVWLGNGSTGTAMVGVHGEDEDILDRCVEAEGGYGCPRARHASRNYVTQTLGSRGKTRREDGRPKLRSRLASLGVLHDKHVPDKYLRGSVEQRRALLAGLMDTDGYAPKSGRSVEFCSTSLQIAQAVHELAASLGYKPRMIVGEAKLNGRTVGNKYRILWTAKECPFYSKRKRGRFEETSGARSTDYESIVGARRVEPQEVCCIAVESPCRTFLAGRSYTVTHNSNQIVRWRVLWELGRNPNLRVGIVSVSKSGVPTKFVSAMRADIESNKWLHVIFPRLRKQTRGQVMWGTNGFIVERDVSIPDPSVQMFGLYGKILGSRLDLIVLDDVCNMENTMTEHSREKMWEWVSGEVLSRLPRKGGRVWAIGHVWHHEDVLHRLSRIEGYTTRIYSAFSRDEKTGEERPLMPHMWTMDELRRREQELGRLASRMLRNVVPRDEHTRIKQSSIDKCLMRGRGLSLVDTWDPADAPTFTGVDLSVAKGRGDLACLFTIAILPDGTRRVLDIRSGRWDGPTTLQHIVDVHRRYGSIVMVENNAAQDYLLQFASELTTVPLKRHTTGMNKYDIAFGVESLGVEFEQGKWQIPCTEDGQPQGEVAEWLRECLVYTPDDHTGDRLMASWIARECARKSGYGQGGWSYRQDAEALSIDTLMR